MKNGKRLTVAERKYLQMVKLDPVNWLICKKTSEEWHLVHKLVGRKKVVPAP